MLTFVPSIEHFVVEEIPAYEPSGEGEHTYLWIEKRGLTTMDALFRLAGALGVDGRDMGYAGQKDRHATTRQWMSVPRVDPERARLIDDDLLRVLVASRHGNKLRVGHLRGNRFEVVLTGPEAPGQRAAIAARLYAAATDGLPNRFGQQRFGAAGDNAAAGLALLRGQRRERDHRKRKLLLSAAQSAVFNRYLELRAASGPFLQVRAGDVLQKTDSGGQFVCDDPAVDQPRVDAGAVVPTGPMPGGRVMEPPPGTPSRALEDQALAEVGATRHEFGHAGRDLPGTRRPVIVRVELGPTPIEDEPSPTPGQMAFRLRFSLSAGAYATVVVAALLDQTTPPADDEAPHEGDNDGLDGG
ncbi:MAG TPA: tRNA pseudouridine(13) synthase TruD [Polyangia bacterium]|jgi:tRNA pseudouridine13 synthase|nr:tRNA pseudouridine(13) synthase TruD [Polyangia bacterium]